MARNITAPQDAEWLLAQAIEADCNIRCTATDEAEQSRDAHAQVIQVGCTEAGPIAWRHTVDIDVWAGESPDYADAWSAALSIVGSLARIGVNQTGGWRDMEVTNIYKNPSAAHPDVPRVTITANAVLHGTSAI